MLRVLELYSGIGGFHFALAESQIPHEVVAAADINNVANNIYKHNFKTTKIMQRCIECLTVRDLDLLAPDLIHMSPPCQPFVRVGKQQDADDKRTQSFLHLIEVIPLMKKQPQYIFLENVKGFDTSETRDILLSMLRESGYTCQEFLLSPLQFGIPNSRLRYYLLAKLKPLQFDFETSDKIIEDLPSCARPYLRHRRDRHSNHHDNHLNPERETITNTHNVKGSASRLVSDTNICHTENGEQYQSVAMDTGHQSDVGQSDNTIELGVSHELNIASNEHTTEAHDQHLRFSNACGNPENSSTTCQRSVPLYEKCQDVCRPLSDYLEAGPEDHLDKFLVPPKFLRRFWVMDIVRPHSRNTCCFTKRYGHHIEGAGSVIRTSDCPEVDLIQYKKDRVYTAEVERGVESLRLRFFTPREIANLMCFPAKFEFPPDVSTIQCYRVLGNSLNVHVVSVLLRLLIKSDPL